MKTLMLITLVLGIVGLWRGRRTLANLWRAVRGPLVNDRGYICVDQYREERRAQPREWQAPAAKGIDWRKERGMTTRISPR